MKILDNDIASTEPFGVLDGKTVKLVTTRGGLNLAVGTDKSGNENVLGAASHRAILCYTIEQRYPSFQPMIMKSEGLKLSAESHSHFLTDDLRKSGHDIYSIQNGDNVDFYVTKLNIKVGAANGCVENGALLIKSLDIPGEFSLGISSAFSEKALSSGLQKVRFE
jgi:hypothetical protein